MSNNKSRLILIISIIMIFTISGCSETDENNENKTNSIESTSIISPNVKLNEEYYRGVLPYKQSPINGMLREIPSRLDNKYFELGLLELAKNIYDPSKYVFQEGQILTMNEIEPLLDGTQYSEYEDFVYAVTEHDYLYENGDYGGVMIGVLVSPKYYLKDEDGNYVRDQFGRKEYEFYSEDEILQKSKDFSKEIVALVERKNSDIPITVGVMEAQTVDMKLPGTFFLLGKQNEDRLEWETINERYVFLPTGSEYQDETAEIARVFDYFKEEMDNYLPDFAGITGLARYVNGNLIELTITSLSEFDSTVEVIQYTQFAVSRINKYFPEETHVNFYVKTIDRTKALYVKKSNGDDFMHIFKE